MAVVEPSVGKLINYSSGSQSDLMSKWYNSGDQALGYAGSGKTYYMYICAQRWKVSLRTDYNFFGSPVYYAIAQYWNGSSWVDYGTSKRVDGGGGSNPDFTDDGSDKYIWRVKYWSVSGQFLEYLYGGYYIRGYAYGDETTYNNSIRGKLIRLKGDIAIKVGKSWQDDDCVPTDSRLENMYNLTLQKGTPLTWALESKFIMNG